MSVASNLLTAVVLGPVVVTLSALSLSVLCRSMEWITSIAKNPAPKGFMKDIKPHMKTVQAFLERIFGGKDFQVNTTSIMLMSVVVVLICILLTNAEIAGKKQVSVNVKTDKKNN